MQQELERISRLLGLLYPHLDIHSAYLGLQSKNLSVHDNALEFLDNVLKPQLREIAGNGVAWRNSCHCALLIGKKHCGFQDMAGGIAFDLGNFQ